MNNISAKDMEARFPQLELIDASMTDPDGKVVWAGETVYTVFHKYSPMGDPLFYASADWCRRNNVRMIDD